MMFADYLYDMVEAQCLILTKNIQWGFFGRLKQNSVRKASQGITSE